MTTSAWMRHAVATGRESVTVFLTDVGRGLLDVSHSMLAMVGLAVVAATLFLTGQPDARDTIEAQAWGWLQARHLAKSGGEDLAALAEAEPTAGGTPATLVAGASATDPAALTRSQANVAAWISRRYHVAPEPVARLVQEAWTAGQRTGLEPTTILGVMAIESSFNPFAQSPVGAQGLMQVMTKVHNDKYQAFGGRLAAFDPVSNLRVGVAVLKDCISRGGNLEQGLRHYVGASAGEDDGGYPSKVIGEAELLRRVAAGQNVSPNAVASSSAPAAPHTAARVASATVLTSPAATPSDAFEPLTPQIGGPVAMRASTDTVAGQPLALAR